MEWLYGKTIKDLEAICSELQMPLFASKQIAEWLYKGSCTSIDNMTNISLSSREKLSQRYTVGLIPYLKVAVSADGTKKYLFPTISGKSVETAYIPDRDRSTLCVSSQIGCRMGCSFCMTGKGGFNGNLTSGEILNQLRSIDEYHKIDNIVYMGMGEPLDNVDGVFKSLEILTSKWGYGWSPTRITLSTAGIIPAMREFLDTTKVNLAVSLHSPFSEERETMMPIERKYPISSVVALLEEYDFSHQRRVSFEYILLKGINDSTEHINALARLLNRIKCRINIIRFHKVEGSPYESPSMDRCIEFRDRLTKKGITTTIRTSKGEDIDAACGQLSERGL